MWPAGGAKRGCTKTKTANTEIQIIPKKLPFYGFCGPATFLCGVYLNHELKNP